jgi:RimJ/RimL family protein N-acetyltransferase
METPIHLEGPNILLRPLTEGDADAIYASLEDEESRRLTGTHQHFDLDQVRAHCAKVESAPDRWDFVIALEHRAIGELVINDHDPWNKSASLRMALWYAQDPGNAYRSEALGLIPPFVFGKIGLHRLELEVFEFNPRARHVYERAGFVHEGRKREALLWDGERVDAHEMAMLRADYARLNI